MEQIMKCSVCGVVNVEVDVDDTYGMINPPVCDNKECIAADCARHREANGVEDISDCYPDGRLDGAFEHKGTVCPECGHDHGGKENIIACDKCNWTDF